MSYRIVSLGSNTQECLECLARKLPDTANKPIMLIGDDGDPRWEEGDFPPSTIRIKLSARDDGAIIEINRRFPDVELGDIYVLGDTSVRVAAAMAIRCGSNQLELMEFDGERLHSFPISYR